jgi:hypothetical protein
MTEATLAISRGVLRKLLQSACADDRVVKCEVCNGPVWDDEERSSVSDVPGCWFAATRREQDRPAWCLERHMLGAEIEAMENEFYACLRAPQAEGRG